MFVQLLLLSHVGKTLPSVLTYRSDQSCRVGAVMRAPLGARQTLGVVIEHNDLNPTTLPESRLRALQPENEIFQWDSVHFEWLRWIAQATHAPLADVLRHALPAAVFKYRKREVRLGTTWVGPRHGAALRGNAAPKPLLIQTVSASERTEKIHSMISEIVRSGKQALLLIADKEDRAALGDFLFPVSFLHSGLSVAEELREWERILSGEARLLIGTRSAIFAPMPELGMIVIDEAHSLNYKEEKSPYYDATVLAEKRAELCGARLVLMSPAPRAEHYYKAAMMGEWDFERPEGAIGQSRLQVTLVDMRDEPKQNNFSIFSRLLQKKIRECLDRKQRVILFVNRRGQGALLCRDCGNLHTEPFPTLCAQCRSVRLRRVGVGTERVESEAHRLFPAARIVRAEGGIDAPPDDYDILVGTYMGEVRRGKSLGLLGMVLADVGMNLPDFRSGERLFQLITALIRRAGEGESVIQTYHPDFPAIQMSAERRIQDFMKQESDVRRSFGYPPFSRIFKLTVAGTDEQRLLADLKRECEALKATNERERLGLHLSSAPAFRPKKSGRSAWHVFVRGARPERILDFWQKPDGWRLEVDPLETF